jgi:hypothetical protein
MVWRDTAVRAAYEKYQVAGPRSEQVKARMLRAMARAGDLTAHGARVRFLKLEGLLLEYTGDFPTPPGGLHAPNPTAKDIRDMVATHRAAPPPGLINSRKHPKGGPMPLKSDKPSSRVPSRVFYGQGMATPIGALMMQADTGGLAAMNSDKTLRSVMGYPVPAWQRPLAWSDEQCERFVQSVYAGVFLGMFIYNDSFGGSRHLNGLLVDGQQRLHAIERYVRGDLAVAGPDGVKHRWTELTDEEQVHFTRIPFNFEVVRLTTEAELKNLYNLFNFAGTPHTEDQRAVS